jgi:hypothetical protein
VTADYHQGIPESTYQALLAASSKVLAEIHFDA